MTSQTSHMKQSHKSIAQMNHMKQVMIGMMSQTRFKNHSPQEFVKIQLMGMGNYAGKHTDLLENFMNDAC